jgi:hypothetical protein
LIDKKNESKRFQETDTMWSTHTHTHSIQVRFGILKKALLVHVTFHLWICSCSITCKHVRIVASMHACVNTHSRVHVCMCVNTQCVWVLLSVRLWAQPFVDKSNQKFM